MFTVPPKYHKTSIVYVVILNIIVLGATLTLFFTSRNNEALAIQNDFKFDSAKFVDSLQKDLESRHLVLQNFQSHLNGGNVVSDQTFEDFVARQGQSEFSTWSMGWVQRIEPGMAGSDLEFKQWDESTQSWALSNSPADYPVVLGNTPTGAESPIGYDLSSQPKLRQAMAHANETKAAVAVPNPKTFSTEPQAAEILLLQPIWAPGSPDQEPGTDTDQLLGFALGIIRIDQLLSNGIQAQRLTDISIEMNDNGAVVAQKVRFSSNTSADTSILPIPLFSEQIQFGATDWLIKVIPDTDYLQSRRGVLSFALLLGGVLVTLLVNALTWFMVFETYAVREQVIERTEALNSTNELLWSSTNELNKTKTILKAKMIEKEQIEESLAKANQKLAKDKTPVIDSAILDSMTREIRVPMHGMLGVTDLLNDTPLDHQQMGLVQTIKASGETLLTTINDIVDFTRIESGELPIVLAPFNLRRSLEESLEVVSFNAYEKDVELVLHMEPSVPDWVESDERRIQQIVSNLLSNAVNFTDRGEILVTISGREVDQQHMLQISVKDSGVGIPGHHLKTLFEPAADDKDSIRDRFLTSGLSLSICKRLAELLGGTITVESTERVGTTFTLTILANVTDPLDSDPLELELNNLKGKHGLIVFPNDASRKLLATYFTDWDVTYDYSSSASEAIKLFQLMSTSYDFIVFDAKLGEMDCGYFVQSLKRITDQLPPLIAYTTLNSLQAQMFETVSEIEMWLYKPIKNKPLYNAISDYFLQKEHAPAENYAKLKKYNRRFSQEYPLQILIAEDNRVNQKVAANTLAGLGYEVDFASNGLEALERVVHKRYDLVFIDILMPRMSGVQAIKGIKRSVNRKLEKKPIVIAMTNEIRQEEKERCVSAGANGFILKPFRVDHLVRILKDVHSHRAKRFEKAAAVGDAVVPTAKAVQA